MFRAKNGNFFFMADWLFLPYCTVNNLLEYILDTKVCVYIYSQNTIIGKGWLVCSMHALLCGCTCICHCWPQCTHTYHSPSDFLLKPHLLIHSHLPRVLPTPGVKVHPLNLATLQVNHTKEDRYTCYVVCLNADGCVRIVYAWRPLP